MQKVYYYSLGDIKKDVQKVSPPWLLLTSNDSSLSVGTLGNHTITRKVTVHTDLSTSVTVCGMPAKGENCSKLFLLMHWGTCPLLLNIHLRMQAVCEFLDHLQESRNNIQSTAGIQEM